MIQTNTLWQAKSWWKGISYGSESNCAGCGWTQVVMAGVCAVPLRRYVDGLIFSTGLEHEASSLPRRWPR